MHIPLLTEILITFGLSVVIVLICHRLGIPTIVGFLLTGVVAGPHGLGLVSATEEVKILAEIGVVLLLFTIGIEFSLTTLFQIRRFVIIGGLLQVILTAGGAFLITSLLGFSPGTALFCGFLLSLSSTAIVLQVLQERAEIESPHGRMSVAILIFQDVIAVPMMLVIPLLAGEDAGGGESLPLLLAKGAAVIVLVPLLSKFVIPWLFRQTARARSRELFVLSAVLVCFAIAWGTSSIGLSLGLGAFLAGLIISDSEYSHQALGGILPFRDIFTSLFFVSIGMLLDFGFIIEHPLLVLGVVVSVLLVKTFFAAVATAILGFPFRTSLLVGICLGQIGEFSFVLAASGERYGLFSGDLYQIFLSASVLTMAAAPFLLSFSPQLAGYVLRLPIPDAMRRGRTETAHAHEGEESEKLRNHMVIVGYGVNGRNIARAARAASIPYVIIEMNVETVREERSRGVPVIYGDATYEAVLEHAGVEQARTIAVVINDPIATRRIIQLARGINPESYIIVRTRFIREIEPLRKLGASEVVPEEFETSVEIFSRILAHYLVPREQIEHFVGEVRRDEYGMFRTLNPPSASVRDLVIDLPELELSAFQVEEGALVTNRTLADLDLRRNYSVTILEIRRGDDIMVNPAVDERILAGDVLVVMGTMEERMRFAEEGLKKNMKYEIGDMSQKNL